MRTQSHFCQVNLRTTTYVINISHFPCHLHSVIVVMSRVTKRFVASDVLTAVSDEVMDEHCIVCRYRQFAGFSHVLYI